MSALDIPVEMPALILSDAASQHRVKARTHNAGSKLPDDAHWVTINGHPVLIGGGKDAALSQDATCPACKGACQDGKCPTCGQTCQPKDDAVGDGATALRGDLRASHGEGQERDARGRFAATAQEAVDYAAKASKEAIGSPPGRRGAAARDAHGAANTAAVVALKESASGRSNDAAFKACARAANEYHHTADLHNDADLNSSDGHDSYHEDAADACRSAGEALQELANHHLQSWTGSTKPEDMAMSQTDTALADDLNLGHGLNIDLELGDVAGHEFHGNQYTHQGAVDAVKKASDATNSTKGARAGKRHVDASDDAKRLVKDGLYSAAASRCRDAAEGHANASEAPRLTQLERGQHRMAAREHIETAKYLEGAAEQHGQYLAGQRVAIKPEWQDPGDDARDFRVVEDRGNAVVITHDAGLPINPQQSVGKNMIEPYHDRPQTDLTALPAVAQSNAVTAAQQLHDDTHAAANDVSMSAYVEHKYHTTQAGQAASRALAAGDTPEAIQHHLDAAGHLREAAAVGRTVRGVYENRGLPVAKSAANDPEKLEDLATRHTSMAQGKRMSLQADEMRRQAIAAGWNPEDDDDQGRKYGDAHNANVQGRQNDFQIKGLSHDLPIELGDVAGHAFHGNQFTATESSAKANAAIRNYKLFPLAGTVQKGALAKSIASTSDNNVALVTAKKAIASGAAADHDKAAEQFQKAAKGHVLAAQHHEEDGSDVSLEFASMHHAAQKAAISAAREHEEESRRIRGAGEHVVRLPSAGRMQALRDNAAKAQAEAHPPRRPRDARLSLDVPLELGDVAGHEFRGNQYSAGQPKEPDAKKAIQYEQADYAARIAAGEAMNAHHHGGPPQALTPDIEDSMHHWIGNRLGDAAVKHMKAAKLAEAVGDQPGTEDHDEQARALMAFMHLHEHGASDHEFEDRKGKLKDHPAYAAMQERADAAMKTAQQAGKAYRASTASPGEKASLAVRASEAFADSAVKHRAAGSTNRASNHFGRARFYRRQAEQHAKG